jgi:predicted AAA+ superfamily ATPase
VIERHLTPLVEEALADTRVVMVAGARQVGKSTLAEGIAADRGTRVLTLDDRATRQAAIADPHGFVADLGGGLAVIDEVQRAPDLLLAIKVAVDREPSPGRFLLTGSANVLTLPSVADALTGRMEILTLWPFSQAEIEGSRHNLVDALFAGAPPRVSGAQAGRAAWVGRAIRGGYPEALRRPAKRRSRWFENYVDTTLARDLSDLEALRRAEEMPRLLSLLATQSANIVNWTHLGSRLGLDRKTVHAYASLLETVYLVRTLPGWRPGLGNREVQAPKVYLGDSGLLAALLRADERRVASDDQISGKVYENFVAMEVVRHLPWAETAARPYHYRDSSRRRGGEIDLLLEDRAGRLVAIEAKARASVDAADFAALQRLRDSRDADFRCGVVVYSGEESLPFGDRLWALPVGGLWQ